MSHFQRLSALRWRGDLAVERGRNTNRLVKAGGKILLIPKVPGKRSIKFPTEDQTTGWTLNSVRTGAIGIKAGMTQEWDNYGIRRPLTIIKLNRNEVTQVKEDPEKNFYSVQVGCTDAKVKHVSKAQLGQFAANGANPKRKLYEFKVTKNALLPVGTPITCRHFVVGQKLTIKGKSKGKGFQGVMKRWGFSGGAASHGNSLAHRTPGSTGARQDPGKVWKGKKMPGHMGNESVQVINSRVFEIYPELDSFAVIGCIPGPVGGYLKISDSLSNIFSEPPPFPTFAPKEGESVPNLIQYQFKNPYAVHLPDLKENYWDKHHKDVERLFNGKWIPVVSANLPSNIQKLSSSVDRLKYSEKRDDKNAKKTGDKPKKKK